jgi:hypothetical protein
VPTHAGARQVDRHDPLRRHAGDIHDVVAIEHRERARLVEPFDDLFHHRLRHIRQLHCRQERVPEFEDARGQAELAVAVGDVAELGQREKEAPGDGA